MPCCSSGVDTDDQESTLDDVSDDQSVENNLLPNDGQEDATTPKAPSTSVKGLLYCQVHFY